MRNWRLLVAGVGFMGLAWKAHADPYVLESSTLDSGGGTSGGGGFMLTGTIGQPDAGILSGGGFTLDGGFWPGIKTLVVPGAPTLVIESLDAQMRISWKSPPGRLVLESAPGVWGEPWTVVPGGAQSPVVVKVGPASQFFRLRRL